MALATRPSMPGWLASRTRRTSENWAWCADNLRVAPGDSLGGLDGLLRVVGLLALAVGVHHDDAYRGAEGAVAAVGLDVLAARAPAAPRPPRARRGRSHRTRRHRRCGCRHGPGRARAGRRRGCGG